MGRAKDIIVKVIPAKAANKFIKKCHYSGNVVNNSKIHFGAFLDNRLHGVMSFGSPLDKKKVLPLVQPSLWNEMLELNRMAFDDHLPKNSESRCIAIAIKLLKKKASHIKWILSYADGTQCGDGTIYRASGFALTGIKKNTGNILFKDGQVVNIVTLQFHWDQNIVRNICLKNNIVQKRYPMKFWYSLGAKKYPGYQLRYIYLIDKSCKITVPILPFSKIDEMGAGMYKGVKRSKQAMADTSCTAEGQNLPERSKEKEEVV